MYRVSDRSALHAFLMVIVALFVPGCAACPGRLKLGHCYRFESANYEGSYLRHAGFKLYRHSGSATSDLYWKDTAFKVVPARNGRDDEVSLQSVNYPTHHVRHAGYNGFISKCGNNNPKDICNKDASWTTKAGLAASAHCESGLTVSFQSSNFPGYYLRHHHAKVMISPFKDNDVNYKMDASWEYHEVSCTKSFTCVKA